MIQVIARPSPFKLEVIQHVAMPGQNIAEILAAIPELPPEIWTHGVVRIGEIEIPQDRWHRVKPKPSSRHMIHVGLRPRGGGSGKNIFATIAAIALIVAATAISGGVLGPAGALSISSTLFAAGSTSAALLAAGVSIVGALALSALAPAPAVEDRDSDRKRAQLGSASIRGNVLAPFEPIPFVAGTHRVALPHLIPPWSESVNDDQLVYAILGLNGAHAISDIRLNGAAIDEFADVEYEVRDVVTDDSDLTLIDKQVFEAQVGAELTGHKVKDDATDELQDTVTPANSYPKWQVARARLAPDEIWLTFGWTGLINVENAGGTVPGGLALRIRIREVGEVTWINLPELHVQRERQEPFRGMVKLRWAEVDQTLVRPDQNQSIPPWKYAFYATNADNQEGFDTDSYFDPGSGKLAAKTLSDANGAVIVFLDEATFPRGTYEIQVQRGYGYRVADFSAANYQISSATPYFFSHIPASSPPAISKEQAKVPVKVSWQSLSSVWSEYPLGEKGLTLIAVKGKNVAISSLTALATGYANIWDGADWDTFAPTRNPAAWTRYIALGGQSIRAPFVPAQLDDANLADFHDFCGDGLRTKLLLHFDGADGSTTFIDSSLTPKTFTASGNAQIDTAQSKFGGASALLDGTGDWISTPDHADFALGSGDFTIDLWFNCNKAGGVDADLCGHTDGAGSPWSNTSFFLDRATSNVMRFFVSDGTNVTVVSGTTQFTDAVNTGWHHMAAVRSGNTLLLFIDGVLEGSTSFSSSIPNATGALTIGRRGDATNAPWVGWIDEFRLSVGIARWTANFTPPAAADAQPIRECNAYFDGSQSLDDCLRIVAGCGRAALRVSDKVGVIIDRDRSGDAPIQLFSQRNSKGLAIRRAFPRLPDGLRVRFNDETNDYQPKEIFVYRKRLPSLPANIEAVTYIGITSEALAIDRANLDLAQLTRRASLYSFECDIENIYCVKGSLVLLAHDTIARHYDSARVTAVQTSGANVTGLTLDVPLRLSLIGSEVSPDSDYPAGVVIQLKDGSTLTKEIEEETDTDTITFTTPFAIPADAVLEAECLLACGPFASVEKRMLVLGVQPQNDYTAALTLVDEAPAVRILASDGSPIRTTDGAQIVAPF